MLVINKSLAVLRNLPTGFSSQVAQEIEQATNLPWQRNAYSDYTSKGYEVVSLLNKDGNSTNTIIDDCNPIPTPDLEKLPTIRHFLEQCNLSLMWVRLNKLEPGACFWEHRDYSELNTKHKVRLHVPICTSPDSYFIFKDKAVHLETDTLWLLRPDSDVHGFINGSSVRIHLIIDCYLNDRLSDLIDNAYLPNNSETCLPEPDSQVYDKLLDIASILVSQNKQREAEELLLKTFLQYNQPVGFSFDLILNLYQKLQMTKKTEEWTEKKQRFLHQESLKNVKKEQTEADSVDHIEGKISDGRLGQFHKDVHSLTYDPDRLERAYDKHAENYDEFVQELAGDGTSGCSHYTTLFFSKIVPIAKNLRVLDAGVGTGIGAVELINFGYKPLSIVGVDLSSNMLAQARKRGVYEALHYACFPETEDILQTDEFDAVLCAGGFSHSAMPASAMPEFARVTRPGGFVVFSVRKSVYEEPNSEIKAMVEQLESARVWDIVAQECGAYLPADGVQAMYIACRVC